MHSPYEKLPPKAFWRKGVAESHPLTIQNLYSKKFEIDSEAKIATAGSCFAQHIAKQMRRRKFNVIDNEPAPPGMSAKSALQFGYGQYSARFANIYVVNHLLQLSREAVGELVLDTDQVVWEKDGRYFDAMRPSVEPLGLESPEEVLDHRSGHLVAVREMLEQADVFVFTLGLTECWTGSGTGLVYPTAPGTIAGTYDSSMYQFRNTNALENYQQFLEFKTLIEAINPSVKFLLTVSPVPLTATASNDHVLAATTYSKSVLRAVAGMLYQEFENVDYFPSYEMVATPFSRGLFYESNLRSVNPGGVDAVMRVFFEEHTAPVKLTAESNDTDLKKVDEDDEGDVCEDLLLDVFWPA